MTFNYSKITYNDSIKIGSDDAPLKIVEYINLRCPDSKRYEEEITPMLENLIENGQVQRILKHFDKDKYGLETGNLFNQYIDYKTPAESYEIIKKLFVEQMNWGNKRISQIPHIAKDYKLSLQPQNKDQAIRVSEEVVAVNVENIPTIFVGDEAFVETIAFEDFKTVIEKHLK